MNAPAPTADLSSAHASLIALRDDLRGALFEREREVDSLLLALIAREHVFMFGLPGVGKSLLTNTFADACSKEYVAKLLSRVSTYEDVFGGLKVSGIMEDRYERISKGYAQSAQILLLDEIWKCNGAVLNSLLTILNERFFDDSGTRYAVPLEVCVGCSNETPEDESLAALYDRFLFRHDVAELRDRRNIMAILRGHKARVAARLSDEEIEILRSAAEVVDVEPVLDLAFDVFVALEREGFRVSTRRKGATMKAIRASAVLAGRSAATSADLLRIADCVWDDPSDAARVYGIVSAIALPKLGEALSLLDAAIEQYSTVDLGAVSPDSISATSRVNRELKRIASEVSGLGDDPAIVEVATKIRRMQVEIASAVEKALYL